MVGSSHIENLQSELQGLSCNVKEANEVVAHKGNKASHVVAF